MGHYAHVFPLTSNRLSNFDRLRVDPDQTSFWEGREFRTYQELNIPALGSLVIRATVPSDTVLNALSLSLDGGWVRMATAVGGTPAGSFATPVPIFAANNMSPSPNRRHDYAGTTFVNLVELVSGGSHTGGLELDVLRCKCAGNTQQSSSVGTDSFDQRGIAAGVYYFRFTNLGNDTVTGTWHARYEVRG